MSSADSAGGGAAGGGRYVDRTHTLSDDSSDEENSNSDRYSKRAKKYTKMTIVDKDENPAKFEQTTTELEYKMVKGEINKKIHLKLFPPNNNFDQYWHPVDNLKIFQDLILNMIKVPEELWQTVLNPNAVVGALYGVEKEATISAIGSDEAFFYLYLPFVEDSGSRYTSNYALMEMVMKSAKIDQNHIVNNCLQYMVRHKAPSIFIEDQHFLSQYVKDTIKNELLQLKDHPKYSSVYRKYQSDKDVMFDKALVAFADYFYKHFYNRDFSWDTYFARATTQLDSTLRGGLLQRKNKCVYILKLEYYFKLPDWKTKVLDSLLDVEFENGQFNAGAD